MRIAFVSRWYPLPGRGHAGLFVRDQVDALRADHDVSVLVPSGGGVLRFVADSTPLDAEAAVPVREGGPLALVPRWAALDRALSRVRGGPPELVHVHVLAPDALPMLLACRRRRIPLVVTEHAGYLQSLVHEHRRARLQVRFVLRRAQAVVTVGSGLARVVEMLAPDVRVDVICNVVDTSSFAPANGADRQHALSVATVLDEIKGTDLLLRAWARMPSGDVPPLVLVGEDPGSRFARLASELGVAERVDFRGPVSRAEVRRLMQTASVYVCASRSETFGVAVAEALACGTPVVSTRCGGPEDFVTEEVGITVPVDDERALEDAVVAVAERRSSYDAAALHGYVERRFGRAAFRERMNDVYARARERP